MDYIIFIEAAKLLYNEHLKYKERNFKKNESDIPIPIKVNKNQNNRKKGGCCG